MKTILNIVLITAASLLGGARAGAQPPPEPPRQIAVNSETFRQLRDPFWPAGYRAASESEQLTRSKIAEIKSRINWPALPLRGVTHAGGKTFIAVIEGVGLVEAGDIVAIAQDSLIYRWRIDNVTANGVKSTRLDVTEAPDSTRQE